MAGSRRRLAARGGVLGRPDSPAIGAPCVLATNDEPRAGNRPNLRTRVLAGAARRWRRERRPSRLVPDVDERLPGRLLLLRVAAVHDVREALAVDGDAD